MAASKSEGTEKPFRVVTCDTFVKGHNTEGGAEADAKMRNASATKMGIKARYEAVASPKSA